MGSTPHTSDDKKKLALMVEQFKPLLKWPELEFLDHLTGILESGGAADAIFLDFAKAFDKVPTRRLLEKVKAVSICSITYVRGDGGCNGGIEGAARDDQQRCPHNGPVCDC
jgi:hypothetical protein